MTDEGYIRNRLDIINRNSVYGLMIDSEITKIVRSHIKRDIGCDYDRLNCPKPPIYIGQVKVKSLKEKIDNYKRRKKEMKATSTQNIKNVKDICFSIENHPIERESKLTIVASTDDDIFAFEFEGSDLLQSCKRSGLFTGWEKDQKIKELEEEVGRWKKEAADCLRLRDEAQKEAYKLKKENEDRVASTVLSKELADTWSNAYYDLSKKFDKLKEEKDQKIRELEIDNKNLSEAYDSMYKSVSYALKEKQQLKEEYEDKIEDLQHKYNLEREANEAQRKFFRKYAGEGVEIEFHCAVGDDEYTYVIVDKEEYKALKNIQNNVKDNGCYSAMIHGKVYNPAQLVDRVLELEKLKTPTIENFANEEPSSRSDILDLAKKCVCGKREQDYGTPESNFQLIADLWNQYLFKEPGAKEVFGIGPMDVAMMMGLMKIARIRNGGGSGDSFVDLAGYAACGGEIWHSNKETNGDSN